MSATTGEEFIPTNWPKWIGKRIGTGIFLTVYLAAWHFFGAAAVIALFVLQSLTGATLVYLKRKGEL